MRIDAHSKVKTRCKRSAKPDSLRLHLNRFVECESNRFWNSNHLVRWFGAHWTGLMITRRRYHVIDRTTAGQKVDREGRWRGPPIRNSLILLSRSASPYKSIVRVSRYDAQQVLRAAVLLGRLRRCFYSWDYAPPRIRSIDRRSSSSPLTCR